MCQEAAVQLGHDANDVAARSCIGVRRRRMRAVEPGEVDRKRGRVVVGRGAVVQRTARAEETPFEDEIIGSENMALPVERVGEMEIH